MGDQDWQRVLADLLERWRVRAGAEGRVPGDWERARRERPDADVLAAAGFAPARSARFPTAYRWTTEALIGLVYSTSFLSPSLLGPRAVEFETELRRDLNRHAQGGTLRETINFAYELARRPA